MFKGFYNKKRFNYLDVNIQKNNNFDISYNELIPKTACFFSDTLNVFIDTSDGVNEDLNMYEYCGRILSCIRMSKEKKFIFLKSAYSKKWSKKIEEYANNNNGKVIPFFKWSFNDQFYSYLMPNLNSIKKNKVSKEYFDIAFFADGQKVYEYPKFSEVSKDISCLDIKKFKLQNILGNETGKISFIENNSRKFVLDKLLKCNLKVFNGSLSYKEYINKSLTCKAIFNPPGIGEYTSRMIDQTALGNLVILRKNSYDQGFSWKEYIPEVDMNSNNYKEELNKILNNKKYWEEKSSFYYENFWSQESVYKYLIKKIQENL